MKAKLFNKIKRHLETNQKNENNQANAEKQDKLLRDLPNFLRNEVLEMTQGGVVNSIHFFKNKN
jgi:hypothetical protein